MSFDLPGSSSSTSPAVNRSVRLLMPLPTPPPSRRLSSEDVIDLTLDNDSDDDFTIISSSIPAGKSNYRAGLIRDPFNRVIRRRPTSPDFVVISSKEAQVKKECTPQDVKEEDKPQLDLDIEENEAPHAHPVPNLLTGNLGGFEGDADLDKAMANLGLTEEDRTIPGMTVPLMPHQIIGVDWMVRKEKDKKYKGGILADEMGIGKTIQALALMLKNKSASRETKRTLIIVPNNILLQWMEEITTKTQLRVVKYHGTGRNKLEHEMRSADVVLTTYPLVWRDGEILVREPNNPQKHLIKGLLYKMNWYRIILDEAADIRNRSTLTYKCVVLLKAELKWCMTGTPLHNRLSDFAAYLDFTGFMTWEQYQEKIESVVGINPQRAMLRLQAFLRACMLRRTKTSEIDGVRILELPPKTIQTEEVVLNTEERMIYDAMETAARVVANQWYKEGNFLKYRKAVYAIITRLRQACCHPWLLAATEDWLKVNFQGIPVLAKDMALDPEVMNVREQLARAMPFFPAKLLDCACKSEAKDETKQETEPETWAGKYGGKEDKHNNNTMGRNDDEEEDPWEHVADQSIDKKPFDEEGEDHDHEDESFSTAELAELLSGRRKRKNAFGQSDRIKRNGRGQIQPELRPLLEVDIDNIQPSAKMKALDAMLNKWDLADPTRKTLVFSSFVQMLRLVGVYLSKKRITYKMYIGPMKSDERQAALKSFSRSGPRTPSVMLVSIKCGGVGLNLTAASNVIMLDHPWTRAAENQAIDRVHRIGQQRPVQVARLVTKDTIEGRILQLQQIKQALSDGTLGEGGKHKITDQDILNLFGPIL